MLRVVGADRDFGVELHGLPGGDVLMAALPGWFIFDRIAERALPINGPATTDVIDPLDLTGGGVLIGTGRGPVRFDPSTRQVLLIERVETGRVHAMHSLSGGDVLIAADQGWFRFDPPTGQVLPVGGAADMTGGNVRLGDISYPPKGGSSWWSSSALGTFFFNPSTGRMRRVSMLETNLPFLSSLA